MEIVVMEYIFAIIGFVWDVWPDKSLKGQTAMSP